MRNAGTCATLRSHCAMPPNETPPRLERLASFPPSPSFPSFPSFNNLYNFTIRHLPVDFSLHPLQPFIPGERPFLYRAVTFS